VIKCKKKIPQVYETGRTPEPGEIPEETEEETASREEAWRRNLHCGFNETAWIFMFRPTDSLEGCKRVFEMTRRLDALCKSGDLEGVQRAFDEIRSSDDSIMNRPSSWEFWEAYPDHFVNAYNHGHWDIIEYLAHQPEINIQPKRSVGFQYANTFPFVVAKRAVESKSISDLERLFGLGWDINAQSKWCPNTFW